MLILNSTEITGNYNISYNGVALNQIDVVKDGVRTTVWRHGEIVIDINGTTYCNLTVTCGSYTTTIPSGSSGTITLLDTGVSDTDVLTITETAKAKVINSYYKYTVYSGLNHAVRLTPTSAISSYELTFTGRERNADYSRVTVNGTLGGAYNNYKGCPIIGLYTTHGRSDSQLNKAVELLTYNPFRDTPFDIQRETWDGNSSEIHTPNGQSFTAYVQNSYGSTSYGFQEFYYIANSDSTATAAIHSIIGQTQTVNDTMNYTYYQVEEI